MSNDYATYHECWDCGSIWPTQGLAPIRDLSERVEEGEPIPSGECPECGALCHPVNGWICPACSNWNPISLDRCGSGTAGGECFKRCPGRSPETRRKHHHQR